MNLALFDFDGTITTGDTFTPFLRFAIPAIRAIVGGLVLTPVLVAHRLRWISTPQTRPLVARVGFQAVRASYLRELGRGYASEVLPTVVRPEALERLRWHQRQGDVVAVVSAGLEVYLGPWCHTQGTALICTELEERHGRMTGRYRHGDCSGARKAELIRAGFDLRRFDTVYAYGDTAEDREMLALANRRYYRWKEVTGFERAG
jgi:phosphatidylglycerophosphatase C